MKTSQIPRSGCEIDYFADAIMSSNCSSLTTKKKTLFLPSQATLLFYLEKYKNWYVFNISGMKDHPETLRSSLCIVQL